MHQFVNIVNAASNLPVVGVIKTSLSNKDYLTFGCALFIGIASPLSHLAENHKHGLAGVLGVSEKTSYLLNRMDVAAALTMFLRSLFIYYNRYGLDPTFFSKHKNFTMLLLIAGGLNLISERIPSVANNKIMYTITHSTWHFMIFSLFEYFLKQ